MKRFQLFDYQQEMVGRIADALERRRSVMVQMPTGTGKTVVLVGFLAQQAEGGVLIVAHRRELVEQIVETVRSFAAQVPGLAERVRVASIQWLTRHLDEIKEAPSLVMIDEAHHALAKTYKALWERFPKTRFLGLTATPCRLNGKGFTDLFDELLCARSVPEFIQMGRLSPFDFVSIRPGSQAQALIDTLKKRGTDGDFQTKEMDEVLNKRPSIERLFQSVAHYAQGKKGIVYAISIAHAEHIATFYRSRGLRAVTISSRTPSAERRELIVQFRDGKLDVLVNVDIFSEGFDCPDVTFIQLARPTLSLAKYLQMVGRGLRVHADKACCTIIDNVGLYHRFGLPTQRWDWQATFRGQKHLAACQKEKKESLLKSNNEDIHAKQGGEMYLVTSRDALLEALGGMSDAQRLEREKAELLSGRLGKVKSLGAGTDLVECITPEKVRFFADLRNMHRIDAKVGAGVPARINFCGYELVRYGQTLYSRTRLVQAIPYDAPDPKRFTRGKFFLAFDLRRQLPDAPVLPSRYRWFDMTGSEVCCFIKGNDKEVFRLIVALYSYSLDDADALIVRDCRGAYWLRHGRTWKEVCRAGLSKEETSHQLTKVVEETMWERERQSASGVLLLRSMLQVRDIESK